jgi:hypothetical protein
MNAFLATLIALPVMTPININVIVAKKEVIFFQVDAIKLVLQIILKMN